MNIFWYALEIPTLHRNSYLESSEILSSDQQGIQNDGLKHTHTHTITVFLMFK